VGAQALSSLGQPQELEAIATGNLEESLSRTDEGRRRNIILSFGL
jgi:hypothetical protein